MDGGVCSVQGNNEARRKRLQANWSLCRHPTSFLHVLGAVIWPLEFRLPPHVTEPPCASLYSRLILRMNQVINLLRWCKCAVMWLPSEVFFPCIRDLKTKEKDIYCYIISPSHTLLTFHSGPLNYKPRWGNIGCISWLFHQTTIWIHVDAVLIQSPGLLYQMYLNGNAALKRLGTNFFGWTHSNNEGNLPKQTPCHNCYLDPACLFRTPKSLNTTTKVNDLCTFTPYLCPHLEWYLPDALLTKIARGMQSVSTELARIGCSSTALQSSKGAEVQRNTFFRVFY